MEIKRQEAFHCGGNYAEDPQRKSEEYGSATMKSCTFHSQTVNKHSWPLLRPPFSFSFCTHITSDTPLLTIYSMYKCLQTEAILQHLKRWSTELCALATVYFKDKRDHYLICFIVWNDLLEDAHVLPSYRGHCCFWRFLSWKVVQSKPDSKIGSCIGSG